jgi:hypothetical protein
MFHGEIPPVSTTRMVEPVLKPATVEVTSVVTPVIMTQPAPIITTPAPIITPAPAPIRELPKELPKKKKSPKIQKKKAPVMAPAAPVLVERRPAIIAEEHEGILMQPGFGPGDVPSNYMPPATPMGVGVSPNTLVGPYAPEADLRGYEEGRAGSYVPAPAPLATTAPLAPATTAATTEKHAGGGIMHKIGEALHMGGHKKTEGAAHPKTAH